MNDYDWIQEMLHYGNLFYLEKEGTMSQDNEPSDSEAQAEAARYARIEGKIEPPRCDANAKRGTGTGMCDHPLNEHGGCPNASNHIG